MKKSFDFAHQIRHMTKIKQGGREYRCRSFATTNRKPFSVQEESLPVQITSARSQQYSQANQSHIGYSAKKTFQAHLCMFLMWISLSPPWACPRCSRVLVECAFFACLPAQVSQGGVVKVIESCRAHRPNRSCYTEHVQLNKR